MRMIGGWAVATACALVLSACGASTSPPATAGSTAPPVAETSITPLGDTFFDDKAVSIAFDTLDVAASTFEGMVVAKRVTPGSPFALKVADSLSATKSWLNAARFAQKAGEASTYQMAMRNAVTAYEYAKQALAPPIGGPRALVGNTVKER